MIHNLINAGDTTSLTNPTVGFMPPWPYPIPMPAWPFPPGPSMTMMPQFTGASNGIVMPVNTTISQTNTHTKNSEPHLPSSPPSDVESNLEEFLAYCQISPTDNETCDGLDKLGITDWTFIHYFTTQELEDAGIPAGPSQALVSLAKKYIGFLKGKNRV